MKLILVCSLLLVTPSIYADTMPLAGMFGANTPTVSCNCAGMFGSNPPPITVGAGLFGANPTPSTQPSAGIFGSTSSAPNTPTAALTGDVPVTATPEPTPLLLIATGMALGYAVKRALEQRTSPV